MKHGRSIDLIPANFNDLSPVDAAGLMELTVEDLRQWERLGDQCSACRRQSLVNQYQVRRQYGGRRLVELQRYLRCTGCGNRKNNHFVITKMARD